jgi:hypothetical protein
LEGRLGRLADSLELRHSFVIRAPSFALALFGVFGGSFAKSIIGNRERLPYKISALSAQSAVQP